MTPAPSSWPSELWNVNMGTPTSNDNTRNCSIKLAVNKQKSRIIWRTLGHHTSQGRAYTYTACIVAWRKGFEYAPADGRNPIQYLFYRYTIKTLYVHKLKYVFIYSRNPSILIYKHKNHKICYLKTFHRLVYRFTKKVLKYYMLCNALFTTHHATVYG